VGSSAALNAAADRFGTTDATGTAAGGGISTATGTAGNLRYSCS